MFSDDCFRACAEGVSLSRQLLPFLIGDGRGLFEIGNLLFEAFELVGQ